MAKDLNEWCEKARRELVAQFEDALENGINSTESPIERAMLLALVTSGARHGPVALEWVHFGWRTAPGTTGLEHEADPGEIFHLLRPKPARVLPQLTVRVGDRKWRIDLAIQTEVRWPGIPEPLLVNVAIECDGHDFHERTKEQAQRDKERDRDLQSLGWAVARFTGSEIFRSPEEAARKAWDFVSAAEVQLLGRLRDARKAREP